MDLPRHRKRPPVSSGASALSRLKCEQFDITLTIAKESTNVIVPFGGRKPDIVRTGREVRDEITKVTL
ncbi:hypothetical protein ACOCG7_15425 [Paraburkholderia sp. DD10]|uniref:hypothetical protein n=1 Tax=Paraburkholderia TaxID=1822464 RepID=UPI00116005F5|nr:MULTISPECIES: hypothetical protein [Paraburkholderia]